MSRFWILLVVLALLAVLHAGATAQPPTATPAQLNLSTVAPNEQQLSDAAATWTPTAEGQVMVEARDFANVRSEPDTNAIQLGQIRSGDLYPATGRYFQWIQFQFDDTRRGWVFGELVNVVGDVNRLPEIGVAAPTEAATEEAGSQPADLAAITQTPGGLLTATAIALQNPLLSDLPANAGAAQPGEAGSILPTFTYPPGIVAVAPTPGGVAVIPTESTDPLIDVTSGSVPPIVPILVLGGIGLLGLAISSLRR